MEEEKETSAGGRYNARFRISNRLSFFLFSLSLLRRLLCQPLCSLSRLQRQVDR